MVSVDGRMVHELFEVSPRERSSELLAPLVGMRLRCTLGWQLTSEFDGRYAGEAAMLIRDDAHPDITPRWIPSGDLVLIDETGLPRPQLPLGWQ